VLSTHTGGFKDYTYRDLTDDILPIIKHWQALGLRFDAVYTGYLGSFAQVDIVSEIFDRLKMPDNLIVVDPVMADNGKLYAGFNADFPLGMKKLCEKADVIVPNMTEASLLLGEKYIEGPYSRQQVEDLLVRLAELGPKRVVLTGVYFDDRQLGAACYDSATDNIDYVISQHIKGQYHGSGDVFASALTAGLLTKNELSKAVRIAVDFTVSSIARTHEAGTDVRFGVNFEEGLSGFAEKLAIH